MAQMDEKINSIRENISNTSVMKEKLESQIQILTEQIHTAEMTDEHLQSRLDAIDQEKAQRSEQSATYIAEKEKRAVQKNYIIFPYKRKNYAIEKYEEDNV